MILIFIYFFFKCLYFSIIFFFHFSAFVDEEVRSKLLEELSMKDLKRPSINRHLTKAERQEVLRKQKEDPTEIQRQNVRNWLVCGVNAVTRAVERNLASLVLVDRGAFTLTRHLMELSAVRGCTFFPLTKLGEVTAPYLSVTQLSALAIKSGEGPFLALVDFVKERAPKPEIPWLLVGEEDEEELTPGSHDKSADQTVSEENTRQVNKLVFPVDEYNLTEVNVTSKTEKGKRKWKKDKEQTNTFKSNKVEGVKETEKGVDYQSANLHKLQANENRQNKKKKRKLMHKNEMRK